MASSGGGGVHFSNKNWEGGFSFETLHFFETTAPWDVINDRSLKIRWLKKVLLFFNTFFLMDRNYCSYSFVFLKMVSTKCPSYCSAICGHF